MSLNKKALKIKAIVLDIDGVLTDGKIGYSDTADEIKYFHVRDGLAIGWAKKIGLLVGAISGRMSKANKIRAKELEFDFIYEGKTDKKNAFKILLKEKGLKKEECLYIGDDYIDIPILKEAGISVIVGDAPEELDEYSDFRTSASGGNGAVRETIIWLLKEQNKWDDLIKIYIK